MLPPKKDNLNSSSNNNLIYNKGVQNLQEHIISRNYDYYCCYTDPDDNPSYIECEGVEEEIDGLNVCRFNFNCIIIRTN